MTFTGYNLVGTPAVQNQRWTGFDYRISGDLPADPTIYQVNAISDCANPLPIELLDFTVREHNGSALLLWSTASELNNDRFELLRTIDGFHFETVGMIGGAENSATELHYSFRDRKPLDGLSYYLLKQVDFDGQESDSELVPYTNENSGGLHLFPNPTAQELTVTLGEDYGKTEVRVYDLTDRLIRRHRFGATDKINFELKGNTGNYVVEIRAKGLRKALFHVMKY